MRIGAGRRLRKFFNDELTDEMIWDEIVHDKNLSNVLQLKALSPEAAEMLIQLERRMELMSLGITSLSEGTARALAKYKGEILLLNNVKELTPEASAAIGRFKGFKLGLQGTRRMSLEVMKGFAPYKGILMLDALESIDITKENRVEAEQTFRQFKAGKLCLNRIKDPSFDLLRCLSKTPGQLELNGIRDLPPTKAAVLVSHKKSVIKLRNLNAMSHALARILVKYNGFIDISGVKDVEHAALKLLVDNNPDRFNLHPKLKKRITDYQAKVVREQRKQRADQRKFEKEEAAKKKELEEKNKKLLEEFAQFEMMDLETAETIQRGHKDQPTLDTVEKETETQDQLEARLNFEITSKKNQLTALMRKGPDKLTDEEKQQVTTLREEINNLKDQIREMMDLLIEEREVGTVVFGSSDDLVKYLKESGAEDDEDDALARIDEVDMFGGSLDSGSDDIDLFGDAEDENGDRDIDIFGDAEEAIPSPQDKVTESGVFEFYEVPKEE